MKAKLVPIKSIKTNPKNPRVIRDEKFQKLVKSIQEFPKMLDLRPIVVNKSMMVLGGNQRLKACIEAGLKEVPILIADELTKAEQERFIITDNVNFGDWDFSDLNANWNLESLENWGLDIDFSLEEEKIEAKEDDYEIPDEIKTDIVIGDLFEIGEHRLLCGDSTDEACVQKLMNGMRWDLMATSPPYNQGNGNSVGYLYTKGNVKTKNVRLYENKNSDNLSKKDYFDFCIKILKVSSKHKNEESHCVSWNVGYNAKSRDNYGKIIFSEENPFQVKETIIWDKTHSINLPQVGIYSRRCEFVFVMSSNDQYRTSQVYNDCRWNYWEIKSAGSQITGEEINHRAAFPVGFAEKMISDFSLEGDLVYEPFSGSGTCHVASHQLKRKCYGMELDSKYCQVIIDRMLKLDPNLEIKKNGKKYVGIKKTK